MKFAVLLFTCASCLAADRVGITSSRTLTLEDAVSMAIRNNLDVRIERENVLSARQEENAARGFYDPIFRLQPRFQVLNTPSPSLLSGANGTLSEHDINASAGLQQHAWRGSILDLSFDGGRTSTNNPFIGLSPYETSQLRFGLTQPLLRGRAIDAERALLKISSVKTGIAKTQLELRVIDIVTRVEEAYWDLAAARDSAAVNKEAADLARTQLEQNRRMIAAGSLAAVELSASEAEQQRRLDDWYASLDSITVAENNLKTLIAPRRDDSIWNQELAPAEAAIEAPAASANLQSAVAGALKARPELREIGQQQDVNGIEQQQNADQVKPALNLVASYSNAGLSGMSRNVPDPITAAIEPYAVRINDLSIRAGVEPLAAVGLGVQAPGGRYHSVQAGLNFEWTGRNREARANLERTAIASRTLALRRARVEQAIEAQVRNAIQALETARQRITAAETGSRAAKEKLESEQRLFVNGESTNFLVLTRQNEYSDAKQRLLAAHLDFNKAVVRFEEAVGETLSARKLAID